MFYYENTFNIADGNVSNLRLGSFVSPTSNVITGAIATNVTGTGTATVTITSTYSFVMPTLDVSNATQAIPIAVPLDPTADVDVYISIAVTGTSGSYNVAIFV
jgi:hypothetical protein